MDFIRYFNRLNVLPLNLNDSNYISLFKYSLESLFKSNIPNISNITSNQYLNVLFKLNELLKKEINPSYNNLHYYFNMKDIIYIVQRFHLFIYKGSNEYSEY